MNPATLRDRLEGGQIAIYFAAVVLGAIIALVVTGTARRPDRSAGERERVYSMENARLASAARQPKHGD